MGQMQPKEQQQAQNSCDAKLLAPIDEVLQDEPVFHNPCAVKNHKLENWHQ
jgi:hypothetical protein